MSGMTGIGFPVIMFVYGSLMRGYSNHFLMSGCKFIAKARTTMKMSLFANEYPFASTKKPFSYIHGEAYIIYDHEKLKELDELEGHPTEYERVETTIELLDTSEKCYNIEDRNIYADSKQRERVVAYMYINENIDIKDWETKGLEFIPSGRLQDSRLAGARLKV